LKTAEARFISELIADPFFAAVAFKVTLAVVMYYGSP
jgi:hypothetical protein